MAFDDKRAPPNIIYRQRINGNLSKDLQCSCCGAYHVNPYVHQNNMGNKSKLRANVSTESSFCSCNYSNERECIYCGNMTTPITRDFPDDTSMATTERSTKPNKCIDLPYQKTNAYQELLKELQVKIRKRNEKKLLNKNLCECCTCNNCWMYRKNINH